MCPFVPKLPEEPDEIKSKNTRCSDESRLVLVLPQIRHHPLFLVELQQQVAALRASILADVFEKFIAWDTTVLRFPWFEVRSRLENCFDFRRVPLPAARMAMAKREFGMS